MIWDALAGLGVITIGVGLALFWLPGMLLWFGAAAVVIGLIGARRIARGTK